MSKKLILSCLLVALSCTGCKKLSSIFHHKEKQAKPAAGETVTTAAPAAPVATPNPAPTPETAPEPVPAAAQAGINKNAVAIALCYHNIDDKGSKALTISVEEFEREMQALKDNGFTVIGMQDFLAWRRGEKNIPTKCAIITLDDGWVSAYDNAWPVLKKFGYPFTLFIYIDYVNTGGKSMTWDQLAEMRDAGVDIECHTFSHSSLRVPGSLVDRKTAEMVRKDVALLGKDGWLRKEIVESRKTLEKQLGIKCNVFAYPFGKYDEKALEMVKEAGYEAAFTVYGQQLRFSTPPYDRLGRYAIDSTQPKNFEEAIKMIGGGIVGTPAPEPEYAQLAAASMITQPMNGETIGNAKPVIKANLATMGVLDPGSVEMRVSGFGQVPAKFDPASKTISFQVPTPLTDKSYTVIISAKSQGKRVETRWSFNFDPTGKTVGPAPAAGLPPQ